MRWVRDNDNKTNQPIVFSCCCSQAAASGLDSSFRPGQSVLHSRGNEDCLTNVVCGAPMSHRGNCYNSAPIEAFWGENEVVHHRCYATLLDQFGS